MIDSVSALPRLSQTGHTTIESAVSVPCSR